MDTSFRAKLNPDGNGYYLPQPKRFVPMLLVEFYEFLRGLPKGQDFAFGSNPYQTPIARYLNFKVAHACFWVDCCEYASEWHEYKGAKTLPFWATQFMRKAIKLNKPLTPEVCLRLLEDDEPIKLARWESSGKRYWVEVFQNNWGFAYKCENGFGDIASEQDCGANEAIRRMQDRIDHGEFNADAAKKPLKRVF